MSETTDRTKLIARLRDYSSGAGYGSDAFIEEVADALAQSEQKLAEQATTISAERSARQSQTDELVDAWHDIDTLRVERDALQQRIHAVLALTGDIGPEARRILSSTTTTERTN